MIRAYDKCAVRGSRKSKRGRRGMTAKQRHFNRIYKGAKTILCSCGCKRKIRNRDLYGRTKKFISGHNGRKFWGEDASNWSREKRWRRRHPKIVRDGNRNYYRRRKVRAMALRGSKCIFCHVRYNGKNAAIFEFHHRNPKWKKVLITRMLRNASWARLLKELKKCDLACANCHNLHHGGGW